MNEERYKRIIAKRGNTTPRLFATAVAALQKEGFFTELWVTETSWILRWFSGDSKWHIEVRRAQLPNLSSVANSLGTNALKWLNAVHTGSAMESSFAVKEN